MSAILTKRINESAGRYDHVHGDEDNKPEPSQADENKIASRTIALLDKKMTDRDEFIKMLADSEIIELAVHLHRMKMNSDAARVKLLTAFKFDLPPALEGFLQAWSAMDRQIEQWAHNAWIDDATKQAEQEFADREL